jgi:hypothetical protein
MKKTRARVRELCGLVVEVYGPNNRAGFSFQRAAEAFDRLCADLQAQVRQDHPGHASDGFYS